MESAGKQYIVSRFPIYHSSLERTEDGTPQMLALASESFLPLILDLLNSLYHSVPFMYLFLKGGYKLVFRGPNLKSSILNLGSPWKGFIKNIYIYDS